MDTRKTRSRQWRWPRSWSEPEVRTKDLGSWNHPWRPPYFLRAFTWAYLAWSFIPIAVAILFSFNNGQSRSSWQGFSTDWYVAKPIYGLSQSVLYSADIHRALAQTLRLATLTTLVAVPLGVAFALGIDHWHSRGSGEATFVMLFAFCAPELVTAVALLFVFALLMKMVPVGTWQQTLSLITYTLPFPVIITRARLLTIDREYEETAVDLGATAGQALRRVILPMLRPAIVASAVLVFARCIDDFVIVSQLRGPASSDTLSVKIYSGYRSSPSPAYNAMTTVMLVVTLLVGFLGYATMQRLAKREGRRGFITLDR